MKVKIKIIKLPINKILSKMEGFRVIYKNRMRRNLKVMLNNQIQLISIPFKTRQRINRINKVKNLEKKLNKKKNKKLNKKMKIHKKMKKNHQK